jgi:hypothetical protein
LAYCFTYKYKYHANHGEVDDLCFHKVLPWIEFAAVAPIKAIRSRNQRRLRER